MLWFLILLSNWKEATSLTSQSTLINRLAATKYLVFFYKCIGGSLFQYFPLLTAIVSVLMVVLQNGFGGLHGGAVAAVAERVAIGCARSVMREDKELFLGELSISYLSAAPQNVCFFAHPLAVFNFAFDTVQQCWIYPLLIAEFMDFMLIGLATCLFCVVRVGHWCFGGEDRKKCDCSWGQFQIEKVWKACLHCSSYLFQNAPCQVVRIWSQITGKIHVCNKNNDIHQVAATSTNRMPLWYVDKQQLC